MKITKELIAFLSSLSETIVNTPDHLAKFCGYQNQVELDSALYYLSESGKLAPEVTVVIFAGTCRIQSF